MSRAFVKKGNDIVDTVWPTSADDMVVGVGGELTVVEEDGEVTIFAKGEWTHVNMPSTQPEKED